MTFQPTSPGAGLSVSGREGPLGQVFRNLIDNARSFSLEQGSVRLSAERTAQHRVGRGGRGRRSGPAAREPRKRVRTVLHSATEGRGGAAAGSPRRPLGIRALASPSPARSLKPTAGLSGPRTASRAGRCSGRGSWSICLRRGIEVKVGRHPPRHAGRSLRSRTLGGRFTARPLRRRQVYSRPALPRGRLSVGRPMTG